MMYIRGVKNETANKDLIRIQRVSPSFLVTRRMATPFFIFLQGKLLRHFSFLGKHCILRHIKFFLAKLMQKMNKNPLSNENIGNVESICQKLAF